MVVGLIATPSRKISRNIRFYSSTNQTCSGVTGGYVNRYERMTLPAHYEQVRPNKLTLEVARARGPSPRLGPVVKQRA